MFGYELVPRKETLDDGTVLMTVRPSLNLYFQSLLFVLVLEQKTGLKNKLHPRKYADLGKLGNIG